MVPKIIKKELSSSLTKRGIRKWYFSGNRYLDGDAPVDRWHAGQRAKVLEAAKAFSEGYYV